MKQFYILFALVFLSMSSYGQTTLTYSLNSPKAGDTITYIQLTDTSLREGNFGNNQNWDFSHFVVGGITVRMFYRSAATTPYHSVFPHANLALYDSSSGLYTYYHSDSSSLVILGTATALDTTKYVDSEKVTTYPFSYNSFVFDSFQYGKPNVAYFGQIVNTADAFGIAKFPSSIDSGVIRIQTIESIKKILYTSTGADTSVNSVTTYSYYISGKKWPALQIVYKSTGGGIVKSVRYFPGTIPVGIEETAGSLTHAEIYPNPFESSTNLSMDLDRAGTLDVEVYNTLGEKIGSICNSDIDAGSHTFSINRGSLSKGIYIISIRFNGATEMKKLIIN